MAHLPDQVRLLEHLEESARRVDAARDEQRVAVPALQPVAGLHVHQDVGDDLLQPVTRRRAPSASSPSAA